MIAHRNELPALINQLGLTGTGVEVGVYRGEFSSHLVRHSTLSKFFAIDCWTHIEGQDDPLNEQTRGKVDNMIQAVCRLAEFPHATILRSKSVDAARLFEDGSLDFVYIDADHRYEPVLRDLQAWLPKVRKGGIIAGHDFHPDFMGVVQAMSFVFEHKGFHVTSEQAPAEYPSWIVIV